VRVTGKLAGGFLSLLVVLPHYGISFFGLLNFLHNLSAEMGKQLSKRSPVNTLELKSRAEVGKAVPMLVL